MSISSTLSKIKTTILDTLFPITCLSCGKNDVWICQECLNKIEIQTAQVCPYCEKQISPHGEICAFCKEKILSKNNFTSLDGLIVSTSYTNSLVSKMIHLYKYNFIEDLANPLAEIILKSFLENNSPLPDLILPIPLHPRRLRWRGFNQSEKLAQQLSQNLTPGFIIPTETNILQRKKYTQPQMTIKNYQERKNNISGSFIVSREYKNHIQDKSILLVDDVATTGATILECAKVLKTNGAKKVFGAVIARQETK